MRIMVTGGAGFIGSHLVDRLIALGHNVIVLDNESSKEHFNFFWNSSAENYRLNVEDYDQLLPLCKDVDVIFHLAANSRIQQTIKDPGQSIKNNVLSTINVLEAARQSGVRRIVFSSTSSSYADAGSSLSEDSPLDCKTPYSASKIFGENLLKSYNKMYGIECVSLRYFNVYGDRQPTKGTYATVIGIFLDQAKNNESLTIVDKGQYERDFTHVSDIVDATVFAGISLDKSKANGSVYNLGYGKSYSILEVANLISKNHTFIDERPGENIKRLSDSSLAKRDLSWNPKIDLMSWIKDKICP